MECGIEDARLRDTRQDALRGLAAGAPLTIEGETLTGEDVLLVRAPKPGLVVASEGPLTVALDTAVSEALKLEGLAREIVNRVQNWRKAQDFAVSDRIALTLHCDGDLAAAAQQFGDLIAGETLATAFKVLPSAATAGDSLADNIDGQDIRAVVSRVTEAA